MNFNEFITNINNLDENNKIEFIVQHQEELNFLELLENNLNLDDSFINLATLYNDTYVLPIKVTYSFGVWEFDQFLSNEMVPALQRTFTQKFNDTDAIHLSELFPINKYSELYV